MFGEGWYEKGGVIEKPSLTTIPDTPVRERTVPRSVEECKHDYRVLSHDIYKATFYCRKCLNMRTKEL